MKKLLYFCLLIAIQITACIRSGSAVETVPEGDLRNKKNITSVSQLQLSGAATADAATIIFFKKGDVFAGDVDILETAHHPAKLRLYLDKVETLDSGESGIEAIADLKIHNTRVIYGLRGVYVPSYRQIYLQETVNINPASRPGNVMVNNVLFEPVGLAGEITTDGQTINCTISYNGNAKLARINQKVPIDEALSAILRP